MSVFVGIKWLDSRIEKKRKDFQKICLTSYFFYEFFFKYSLTESKAADTFSASEPPA